MYVQDVLPRDAIASIDDPSFGTEYFGDPDDRVIVVEDTPPRAYPVRILSYHEIVNDVLASGGSTSGPGADDGQRPIAVTWCPICGSAAVYDRTADGRVLTFGVSGKLADDALVMYDRETESEWKQPLGRAIDGPLEGTALVVLPAPLLSWSAFRSTYPDGLVLQPVHGRESDARGQSPRDVYDMSRYDEYAAADDFGLREMRGEGRERTWGRDDIDAKTVVVGVVLDGEAVGYPLLVVEAAGGLVTDSVGDTDVVVVASAEGVTAFENPGYDFERREGTLSADGTTWDPTTGRSRDGRELRSVPLRRLYAFAWQDDHGRDSFYGIDSGDG